LCFAGTISEFFRGMLEAGTRGGVVPLDATSLQLKFLMDRVTGGNSSLDTLKAIASKAPVSVIGNSWQALYSLMELDNIANKYLFPQVSQYIHLSIAAYAGQNPPAALLHACRSSPVNGAIATAALKAFRDEMPSWMGQYFQKSSWKTEPSGHIHFAYLPAAYNLHTDFAEALGLRAFLAYTRALEYGSSTTINNDGSGNVKTVSYNWESVARRFAEEAKTSQQVRSRFLHHEDDAASDWFPSTPPRETSLSPYQSSVPLVETPIPGMTPPPG
jgi:hypothetical protein